MKRHLIRAKGLLIAAAIITALAAISFFQPVEEAGWALRNNLFPSHASGSVIVVQIDGKSDQERSERLAAAIRAVSYAHPKHVLLATDPDTVGVLLDDPDTRVRMNVLGKRLVVPATAYPPSGTKSVVGDAHDISQFTVALSTDETVRTSPFGLIWHYSFGKFTKESFTPSPVDAIFASEIQSDDIFLVDYSYNVESISQILLSTNRTNAINKSLQGRSVFIGFDGNVDGLKARLPGVSFVSSKALLHAYAAETLQHGTPRNYGFLIPLLASLLIAIMGNLLGVRRKYFIFGWTGTVISFVVVPWFVGTWHYNFDVAPALALLVVELSLQMRQNWKDRLKLTSSSGAPSFDAFGSQTITAGGSVVVARVGTWTDIQTAIGISHQTELARQIMRRLQGADEDLALHHNGAESFCWRLPDNGPAISEHILGLRALFEVPLMVADKEVDVNLAFGVAGLHTDETDARHRLAGAQSAALEAEQLGIISRTFDSGKMAEYEWNLALHTNIDKAITNGEIWVAYQPKLDLRTNLITGAEALVRWTHPTRGNIPPSEFILHVERSGRMDALTRRVIRDAALSAAKMHALDRNFGVAINLSPALFEKPDLFAWLVEILSERPIRPQSITWEITETREVRDLAMAKPILDRLKAAGFRISLDDFGTGAANMQVLSQLPFDEIKIDQRFVSRMTSSSIDRAIVESAITLGKSAGIAVVAEGVEDHQTLEMLREMGCDMAQGFLIARPDRLECLIRQPSATGLMQHRFG